MIAHETNEAVRDSEAGQVIVDESILGDWTRRILAAAGAAPDAAAATAASLVDASRRGLDSHGVLFLHFYLPRLRAGLTDGKARPEVVVDLPALAVVDGRNALGAYVGRFAMSLCCDKAERVGCAAVVARNSSHFGAASCYAEIAARRGSVGIVASNSDPGMAPLGALAPVLGTNPLAIAAPAPPGGPIPSLDIATSVVAQGRVILARRRRQAIPPDWAIGPDGRATEDPELALLNSVLPMAGYKGFGLAFMLDVLAGCLPGALVSPDITEGPEARGPQGTGQCYVALHVGSAGTMERYEQLLERLFEAVHSAPRAEWAEPFLAPGEREHAAAAARASGIPLSPETASLLCSLGEEYGVAFPAPAD